MHGWPAIAHAHRKRTRTHAHAEHTRRERWSGTAGIAIRRLSRKCQKNCSPRSDREERAGRLRFGVVAELKLAYGRNHEKTSCDKKWNSLNTSGFIIVIDTQHSECGLGFGAPNQWAHEVICGFVGKKIKSRYATAQCFSLTPYLHKP